jgi:hypothetical protein
MPLYTKVLEKIAGQLMELDRTGIVRDTLSIRRLDWQDVVNHKGVTLRYTNPTVVFETNARDDRMYPVFVVIYQGPRQALAENQEWVFTFEENVRLYYHNRRRLSDIDHPGVLTFTSTVTDGYDDIPADLRKTHEVRMQVILTRFREPRENAFTQ